MRMRMRITEHICFPYSLVYAPIPTYQEAMSNHPALPERAKRAERAERVVDST